MQIQEDAYLTYPEACERLGITLGSLSSQVSRGRLHPIVMPGSRRKYLSAQEVAAYRQPPTAAGLAAKQEQMRTQQSMAVLEVALTHIRQAARDSYTDTVTAIAVTTAQLSGMAGDEQAAAQQTQEMRQGMTQEIQRLVAEVGPILVRMQRSTSPDDLNELENTVIRLMGDMAQRYNAPPELRDVAASFMAQAFDYIARIAGQGDNFTIPARRTA